MVRSVVLASVSSLAVLLSACGRGASNPAAPPTAAGPLPAATVAAGEAPMPRRVSFAPGPTISAAGQTGIFFLDPKTGKADGWVVPAARFDPGDGVAPYDLPYAFSTGGTSVDGSKLVYQCLETRPTSSPVPCLGSTHPVWYLLDTQGGARERLPAFTGPSLSIAPNGRTLRRNGLRPRVRGCWRRGGRASHRVAERRGSARTRRLEP